MIENYDKPHCWQYEMRLNNLENDIRNVPWYIDISNITLDDFYFAPLIEEYQLNIARKFIEKNEWLGTTAYGTTNWFGAFYKTVLCGVITIGVPAGQSKLLGENTDKLERLISRGACISWSPKGLASKFVMWCVRWMVNNTQYRLFTAYSDPNAKELGTIYQACNFYYLGNDFGETNRYISPYSGNIISSRTFRSRSYYKKYANDLGIKWDKSWNNGDKVNFDLIPDSVENQLRNYSKKIIEQSEIVKFPSKHKYAYVLGENKKETKELRKKFLDINEIFPYPKERGK